MCMYVYICAAKKVFGLITIRFTSKFSIIIILVSNLLKLFILVFLFIIIQNFNKYPLMGEKLESFNKFKLNFK